MATTQPDREYSVPSSDFERERLQSQNQRMGGATEDLFVRAGMARGWRVLDVGCGVGDVTFLAAQIVGPTGSVVGVDFDPAQVEAAKTRAAAQGLSNVEFLEADIREIPLPVRSFDAVVGRLVLMHTADPTETLRRVARHAKPGGVVAFHEGSWPLHLAEVEQSWMAWPHHPGLERVRRLVFQTARAFGMQPMMGHRLPECFADAGLPIPELRASVPLMSGAFGATETFALARSLLPRMVGLGLVSAGELDIDAIERDFRDWGNADRFVTTYLTNITAWARIPA